MKSGLREFLQCTISMGQIIGYLLRSQKHYQITEIKVVKNEEECLMAIERLKRECRESFPVLGMDCEWVSDGRVKHPVALLQLATVNGFCVLFQLSQMPILPDSIKNILEDVNIWKVGVGIQNDVHRLGTRVSSWVDIRHLEYLIRSYPTRDTTESKDDTANGNQMKLGLAALSKRILGVELNKDGHIRYGNWDAEQLTDDQIKYAAWDALAAVLISYELIHQDEAMQAYSMTEPIDFFKNISELHYKSGENASLKKGLLDGGIRNKGASPPRRYFNRLASRKSPMYDNIFLLAPDGEVLCTCDKKRAMWYVDRGIGELFEEKYSTNEDDPDAEMKTCLKVQLKFEPKRRALNESEKYYCVVKANQCVVCGREESYLRKHIVPHEYRKFFPVWMKSRQSHDVLLLCIDCHVKSNSIDLKLRQTLARDCEAPLTVSKAIEVHDAHLVKKVQSAAKALSRQPENIPEQRRKELEEIILNYFSTFDDSDQPKTEVTTDLLKTSMELITRISNESYVPHGLKVVQHFQEMGGEDGIRELEILWRQHFVKEMNPKHLPPMWSTHHFRMSPERKEIERLQSEIVDKPS